ncbi:MAG: hypothetical protein EPO32_10975 [Anaerolineae bacterium]|nr:MAG: hypothetical protein EPO32_10975 [Anaerolineae bacterium]
MLLAQDIYSKTLYPFQDQILQEITNLETGFYLTGGTAASRGYLQHRYSDDLDFFVNDSPEFNLWLDRVVQHLLSLDLGEIQITSRHDRFANLLLNTGAVLLKLEFINDVPSHIGRISVHPVFGRLDSAENILANKVTALLGRNEPKDLADVWGFCCRLGLPLEQAITDAHSKAAGIFHADLARVLLSASEEDWRAIRWIKAPDSEEFLNGLHQLGQKLLFA